MRTPVAALLLTTLAFLSPTLALAPLSASEPVTTSAVQLDAGDAARSAGHGRTSVTLIDDVVPIVRQAATPVADAPAAAPAAITDQATRFQAALEAARATGGAYGVTFAAVRDGQLLWAGSSGRARDGRTALEAGSPLVIGSVTKTFVSATVLQLVEEGRIRLDAPMRNYLPELSDISGEITIAQLLNHTSGLADVFNDTTRAGLEEHPEHAWTAEAQSR